jgi:hypothetical protein
MNEVHVLLESDVNQISIVNVYKLDNHTRSLFGLMLAEREVMRRKSIFSSLQVLSSRLPPMTIKRTYMEKCIQKVTHKCDAIKAEKLSSTNGNEWLVHVHCTRSSAVTNNPRFI